MVQRELFKAAVPLRPLTERQAAIYALICSVPGGVSADELGAMMHEARGSHAAGDRCEWCGRDGARALREKAIRSRLVRRVGALYEPRLVSDRAVETGIWADGGSVPF